MMPAYLGGNPAGVPQVSYSNDPVLDDLARQIAASQRRFSRGSNGQRPGGAMRIVKPSSANNSPRSAIMQARRRTFMNDGLLARRNHPAPDNSYQQHSADLASDMFMESAVRAARPVSWHPSTHMSQTQVLPMPANQYPFPPYQDVDLLTNYQQFPPTPAAYSGYTSPSSTFSPLSLPYSGFDASSYFSPANWADSTTTGINGLPSPIENQLLPEQVAPMPSLPQPQQPQQQQVEQPAVDTASAWSSFATHGFSTTTPPTPDNFPIAPQVEPKVPVEDCTTCPLLEDEEEEGEILIGMGLYDPPEKDITDSTLESYRRSVAHILGEAYKYPEPTGRGLKLEETWEPPESDDEEEEEEEEEEKEEKDADADEEEDPVHAD